MTSALKNALRDLRDRQSRERGRMAELSLVDELSDEQRSELDTIERGTPDLERQTRAATIALETEEREAETRAATAPDGEQRERIELRSKAMLTNYLHGRRPRPDGRRRGSGTTSGVWNQWPREFRLNCGTCRNRNSAARKASARRAPLRQRPARSA